MKPTATLAVVIGAVLLATAGLAALTRTQWRAAQFSVADYLEIQRLYATFAHTLDGGRAEDYVANWMPDGEFMGGRGPGRAAEERKPIKGRDELRAMGARAGIGTRHFVTNLVITPTPAGAKATAYLLLLNSRPSPPVIVETAIYDDLLVKTANGWKFARRTVWRDDDDITPYKFKAVPPPPAAASAR